MGILFSKNILDITNSSPFASHLRPTIGAVVHIVFLWRSCVKHPRFVTHGADVHGITIKIFAMVFPLPTHRGDGGSGVDQVEVVVDGAVVVCVVM